MQLTSDQLQRYREKGWLVVDGVYTAEAADRLAAFALTQAEQAMATPTGGIMADRDASGGVAGPRKLHRPFALDATYRQFVFDSPMADMVSQLTGQPPLLFTDQIFFKPPRHGSPKAYHQDNAYFLMHPDDHVITAWIALDDVDEANGCLRYIDGSHLGEVLPSAPVPGREHDLTPDPSLVDMSKESLAIVRKGGVVFHHSKALHCSGSNTSDRWRRGYATHWVAPDVTCDTDLLQREAHFAKPELFADLPGRADVVRQMLHSKG